MAKKKAEKKKALKPSGKSTHHKKSGTITKTKTKSKKSTTTKKEKSPKTPVSKTTQKIDKIKSATTMKKASDKKKSASKEKQTKKQVKTSDKSGQSKSNTPTKKTSDKKKSEAKDKKELTKQHNKKNSIPSPKNKRKKEVEDELDNDLLPEEEVLDEEEEEVAEVEEIDLSNIDPVITDEEPLLEDEEEEYTPKTRGRKKQIQQETHHQQTLEEIIRNRPLQIDPTQKTYVSPKNNEPEPYVARSSSNKERYSDKELQEFKEIILQRLKETKENYDQLKKYFTNEDTNGIDDTSPTFKMIEDGSGVMTKEEIEQQLSRLEKFMIDLQNALLRIENKTYGICTVTGKLIPKERLKLVPHATKSIEAKISRDN
ncbi:MAG: hypothetical protein Fur0023_01560 [Bacteroidia bacterium]